MPRRGQAPTGAASAIRCPSAGPAWAETEELLDDHLQFLVDQHAESVAEDGDRLAPECPWPMEGLPPEHEYKQVLMWYVLDRPDPATGKTPLRAYAEREVEDPALRAELLKAEHPAWGEHLVREVRGERLVLEEAGGGPVRVTRVNEAVLEACRAGTRIQGPVHPWGDHWFMNGIVLIDLDREQAARRLGLVTRGMAGALMEQYEDREAAKHEALVLREASTLQSVLNKFPSPWVDGICEALGLDRGGRKGDKAALIAENLHTGGARSSVERLPEEARRALAFLVERGGVAKMGDLERRFSTEVGLFWVERPPTSAVGALRLHGLVVVGRVAGSGGRLYRVAMIPRELRGPVAEALAGPPSAQRA